MHSTAPAKLRPAGRTAVMHYKVVIKKLFTDG